MPEMVIIADDLSGAADCGIACVAAGRDTLVILGDRAETRAVTILSVDANTRGCPAAEAAAETARLTRRHATPDGLLFKKLDSTLRGHFAAELAAMARSVGGGFIIMAPAFPATGRTTVQGIQLLHGTPLEHTEIWQREAILHRAHAPEMLARAGLQTAHLELAQIRGPALPHAIAAVARDHDAVVCDATTDADLQAIARAGLNLPRHSIWAGSAGLARQLPEAAGLARSVHPIAIPAMRGPILFVVGSLSSVARTQAARLAAEPGVTCVTIPPATLRAGPQDPDWAAHSHALAEALTSGADVITMIGAQSTIDLAQGQHLAHALAQLAAPHAPDIGALVATGGETARAILLALGIPGLHLVGEIEPGIPLARAEGATLPVITKAGAFGTPGVLIRCRAALRRLPETR